MSLGQKLKFIRKDQRKSQTQIVMILNHEKVKNKYTVSKYESDTHEPSYGFILKFADKFKVNANWLFYDEEPIYRDKPIEDTTAAGVFELLQEALRKEIGNETPDQDQPPIDLEKISLADITQETTENYLKLLKAMPVDEGLRDTVFMCLHGLHGLR